MVSVILPSYNHAPYLKQRIDSILNQSYQDFELIILDDKSTDESVEVIERYRDNKHISHIVYNEVNSKSTFKQWNKGVALAKGEYIWIAESDDYADLNLLSTLVKALDENNNTSLSYCQSHRMDSNGNVTGDWVNHTEDRKPELFASDFTMDGEDFITQLLIYKNVIPNASAVLFRKETFLKVGGTAEDIKYCADWHIWMKLLTVGDVAFTAQKLNSFRWHEKSVIATAVKTEQFITKYDVLMRIDFDHYLQKCDSENGKSLIEINRKCLLEEIKRESIYQLKKGKLNLFLYYHKLKRKYHQ